MFLHLSQISKFYQNRCVKLSKYKPDEVSIDELVPKSMQCSISELAHDIESAVEKNDIKAEAEAILKILETLQEDEVTSLYGYDLGETVASCAEFVNQLPFSFRYSLMLMTAQSGQIFFNSPSVAYLDSGTRLVKNAYKRAADCALKFDRDDSLARNSIKTVDQNVHNSKLAYSDERKVVAEAHVEMVQVIKECRDKLK